MNKKIVAIVLGAVAVFTTAACGSGSETKTQVGEPLVIERNDNSTNSMSASDCSAATDLILEGLDNINNTVPSLQYASDAEVKSYLTTAKQFIKTSIETVEQCAYLAPTEADAFIDSLNRVDDAIDSVL